MDKIIILYLEKQNELSNREREVIITAIEWMNKPTFVLDSKSN